MTLQDLERIEFHIRSMRPVPYELARPMATAILNWLEDPARRSLDYWLALPPRAPRVDVDHVRQRDRIYRQLAETIPGSTYSQAQIIAADLEIWLEGESSPESFCAPFGKFLREYRELEVPHLKLTALRAVISPKSCQ